MAVTLTAATLLGVAGLLAPRAAQAAPEYRVMDLGVLPGGVRSFAQGLSPNGVAACCSSHVSAGRGPRSAMAFGERVLARGSGALPDTWDEPGSARRRPEIRAERLAEYLCRAGIADGWCPGGDACVRIVDPVERWWDGTGQRPAIVPLTTKPNGYIVPWWGKRRNRY